MAQRSFPFFKLPPELRNSIYRFALVYTLPIRNNASGFPEPGLLTSYKQIRREACSIFYLENRLYLLIPNYNATYAMKMEQKIAALHKRRDVTAKITFSGTVHPKTPNWKNLVDWCRMTHEERLSFTVTAPSRAPHTDLRFLVVGGMFSIVLGMKSRPWEEVMKQLQEQRLILASLDWQWNEG